MLKIAKKIFLWWKAPQKQFMLRMLGEHELISVFLTSNEIKILVKFKTNL